MEISAISLIGVSAALLGVGFVGGAVSRFFIRRRIDQFLKDEIDKISENVAELEKDTAERCNTMVKEAYEKAIAVSENPHAYQIVNPEDLN